MPTLRYIKGFGNSKLLIERAIVLKLQLRVQPNYQRPEQL
jgi:hypothetical protein